METKPTALLTPQQVFDLIEQAIRLMDQLAELDERDKSFFRELIRKQFVDLSTNGTLYTPLNQNTHKEWPVSDRIVAITGIKPSKRDVITIGKRAASAYRAEYGKNPKRCEQPDKANRRVFCYGDRELVVLDSVINQYYS